MENGSNQRLSWIAALFITACLCAAAWLLSGLLSRGGNESLLTNVRQLPCSASQPIHIWMDGVLYSDGSTLHAVGKDGRQKWSYPVGTGLDFSVGTGAVAAWTGSSISLLDIKNGASILTTTLSDGILSAKVGPTYAAALLGAEHQSRMAIMDLGGRIIDTVDLSSLTVLDYGFFSSGSMLWVLSLNTEGTTPLCQVNTYRPGRVQSGSITDTEQVLTKVFFTASEVQTVGLTYLKRYDYTGTENTANRTLLYGWSLEACEEGDSPVLALAPNGQVGQEAAIQDVRVIGGGQDRTLRLPFPAYSIALKGHTLYGFGEDTVSIYRLNARKAVSYQLPFGTNSCLGLTSDGGAVLSSGNNVYLVSLP